MQKAITTPAFLIFASVMCSSQSLIQPNYGLKSHETLEINKIEANKASTVFYLSVENRIKGGNFCADKDIFIVYPDGSRSRLISSAGIPVCPETYNFRSPGEKIFFTLTFPSLRKDIEWVDLIEECPANCFSFYGITLDTALNRRLDEALTLAESADKNKALDLLGDLIRGIDGRNLGIEGMVYATIISLCRETGNEKNAVEWYNKMKISGAPRLHLYFRHLKASGIEF